MNLLDIILAALIFISGLMSLRVGLIREIFALGALLVGIFVAIVLTRALAPLLPDLLGSRVVTQVAFFLAVFLAVHILVSLVGTFSSKLIRAGHLGMLDRLLGFVFGCLRGAIVSVLIIIALAFVLPENHSLLLESRAVRLAGKPIEVFAGLLPDDARLALQKRQAGMQGWLRRIEERDPQTSPVVGPGVAL
jgi:membrane protein required for colicin V production